MMKSYKPESARAMVHNAVKKGNLIRPYHCELCGVPGGIVAHHWRGYDNPFDVWWICYRCNRNLCGTHDGVMNKEQAMVYLNGWGGKWVYELAKTNPEITGNELMEKLHQRARQWFLDFGMDPDKGLLVPIISFEQYLDKISARKNAVQEIAPDALQSPY